MTIIDTTLYANGALRLSRHGAGRGGNVLVHVPSGKQLQIEDADGAHYQITRMVELGWREGPIYDMLEFWERDKRLRSA
jgi:hypothetical protein